MTPPYSTQSVSKNFAGVCKAPITEYAVVFVYKPKKGKMDNFKQKEMTVAQMEDWLNKEDFEELIKVIASHGSPGDAAYIKRCLDSLKIIFIGEKH